jgi:superfamily II DNA helicase RecQ
MMLLTATATPRVRKDILLQMNLLCENVDNSGLQKQQQQQAKSIMYSKNQNNSNSKQYCAFFMQSFNRSNLQYAVEYKTSNKAALDKILNIIKKKFQNKCGIVYCISRNECESVSTFLRQNGLKALAYHAGMPDKARSEIQHQWTNNIDCKIVCATIGNNFFFFY